jgi:hypothetical protein
MDIQIEKIISGGQTGADRAALDISMAFGIPHGGWIPKGRKTEDGRLPDRYRMKEVLSISYAQSSQMNVLDSDGTLIVSHGRLTGVPASTQELSKKHRRPCLHIDLEEIAYDKATDIVCSWIEIRGIHTLNVAGPRATRDPNIYEATKELLKRIIQRYMPQTVEDAVERMLSLLSPKDKNSIAHMEEDQLHQLHPSVGVYIQRRFGLWSENKRLVKSCMELAGSERIDGEDASAVIIKEIWKKLRESHLLRIVK